MSRELDTKEMQEYELRMLKAFAAFAAEEGLRWYLAGGTLLGAVRHGGFIPWDDDIDIMMPRPDYERMLKTFSHERYFVRECRKDPQAAIPFAQILDSRTELKWEKVTDADGALFMDIFPIDGYPANELLARVHTERLWFLRLKNNMARKKPRKGERYLPLKKLFMLLFRKSPNAYAVRMNRLAMKYSFEKCRFVGVTTTTDHLFRERNPKGEVFGSPDPLLLPFEDMEVPCPAGYDLYLRHLFGDYMQLPPKEQQKSVHSFTVRAKSSP